MKRLIFAVLLLIGLTAQAQSPFYSAYRDMYRQDYRPASYTIIVPASTPVYSTTPYTESKPVKNVYDPAYGQKVVTWNYYTPIYVSPMTPCNRKSEINSTDLLFLMILQQAMDDE